MSVGKTSLGKKIASRLGASFIDLDHFIEKSEGKTISEIWSAHSEGYFRDLENKALQEIAKDENELVISTGGGTPCFADNLSFMLDKGVVVWLQLDAPQIISRLGQSGSSRPLIAGKSPEELEDFVVGSLAERSAYYEKADIHFDAHDVNAERLGTLVEKIKGYSR